MRDWEHFSKRFDDVKLKGCTDYEEMPGRSSSEKATVTMVRSSACSSTSPTLFGQTRRDPT